MLFLDQKLHIIGHCVSGCDCLKHIACIKTISRLSENVKCILNLGDHVGFLNDFGQFSLFKIACQSNNDSPCKTHESVEGNCTCTLTSVSVRESNVQLAACDFNGRKILLVDGKLNRC